MSRDRVEALLWRARWLGALALLAVLIPLGWRAAKAGSEAEKGSGDTRYYVRGAELFWEGRDLYYVTPRAEGPAPNTSYTYPPPFAAASVWMLPLPYAAVRVVWFLAMLACSLLAGWLVWRQVGARDPPTTRPCLLVVLTVLVVARFWINDLAHGQVNGLVTLLLMLALERASHRKDVPAGVCLALALCIKPTSWLLVPWFLCVDRRPRLIGVCLGTAAAVLLLPAVRYGVDGYARQVSDWLTLMGEFATYNGTHPGNGSLAVALARFLAGSSDMKAPLEPLLFSLERGTALALGRALATLAVGAAFLFLALRRRDDAAAPAAVLVLGALLSPVTWKAHLVVLLLPAAWVARSLSEDDDPGRARWAAYLAVLALFVLPSRGVAGLSQLEAYGSLSWGLVVIFVLLTRRPVSARKCSTRASSS